MKTIKKTILLFMTLATLSIQNFAQTVSDIDGNVYNTVTIGTQIWMQENLMVTHYNNGDKIPYATNNQFGSLSTGARGYYYNDSANYAGNYGPLYNWFAVTDARKLCPAGWHAPSDSEFTALSDYLGGYLISGGKLKETGTAHWLSPNTGATNSSGFTALPGGLIWEYSWAQGGLTSECIFWTSTAMGAYDGSSVLLVYDSVYLCTLALSNRSGASVRCLCDSAFNSTESIPSGEEFRIFPNPANDNITIASPENAALEITDINGQTLMHTTIQKGKTDIDISRFAKGIYIMRWQNNNKTEVSRFLKE